MILIRCYYKSLNGSHIDLINNFKSQISNFQLSNQIENLDFGLQQFYPKNYYKREQTNFNMAKDL